MPHHLLDVWPVTKSAAVAEYQELARARDRRDRRPRPHPGPGRRVGALPARRARSARVPRRVPRAAGPPVRGAGRASGPPTLHRRLAARRSRGSGGDPAEQRTADRARAGGHRTHRRAVHSPACRASTRSTTPSALGLDRDDLDERVEQRVHRMMSLGFLDEIRALLPAGLRVEPDRGQGARLRPAARRARPTTARSPATSTKPSPSRCGPPAGSCAGSGRGFAATHGSTGSTAPTGDLVAASTYPGLMHVLKGHGTENDFVVIPDLDGAIDLTPELVRALCDRHRGLGADGVLRVVRSENDPEGKDVRGRRRVLHGLPQRRRQRRRDVRKRNSRISAIPNAVPPR